MEDHVTMPEHALAALAQRLRGRAAIVRTLMLSTALSAVLPQYGAAQTPPPPPATTGDAAPALQDVVIHARKRAENIQKIPASITHVTARTIKRDNLNNVNNLATTLPSFYYSATNPKQTQLAVRGVGDNGSNLDGVDPSVGVFLDGVYVGRLGEATNYLYDLDSIDLLRGPQGTLFGKNTIGGALLINSAAPSFTPGGYFQGDIGSAGYRQAQGAVTGPVLGTDGKVAFRISAFYNTDRGYQKNIYSGAYNDQNQGQGARLQILAKPTSDLTIRVIGAVDQEEYNVPSAAYYEAFPGTSNNLASRLASVGQKLSTDPYSYKVNQSTRAYTRTNSASLSIQADWNIGYGTITSISGWRNWHFRPANDIDGTQLDAIPYFGSTNSVQTYSQELRWASPAGSRLETVAGAYAAYQHLDSTLFERTGSDYGLYAGVAPPAGGARYHGYGTQYNNIGFGQDYTLQDTSEALFAHSTFHITPKWSINGGIRYTDELKTETGYGYAYQGTSAATVNAFNGSANTGATGTVNYVGGYPEIKARTDMPGADAGFSYQATPTFLAYAEYAHGNVSAGLNTPYLTNTKALSDGASQVVKPETADSFEIGAKTEWFDRRLLVNFDAYREKVNNYQTTEAILVGGTSATFLANVGSEISQGFEVETVAQLLPGLSVTGWADLDDAYYGSFKNGQCPLEDGGGVCNYTGKQVPFSSKFSFDIRPEYDYNINEKTQAYFVADYNWRSAQNLTLQLSPISEQGAYGLLNFRFGSRFENGKYDLSFYVNNATNQHYFVTMAASNQAKYYTADPGIPLNFGGTLRVYF